MILILGGGLTGLSTGLHLGQREHLILEREESTGGLCRSFQVEGFTFDLTGHLLHLRDDTIRNRSYSPGPRKRDRSSRRQLPWSTQ